jgi:Amt family ammonium transporter
MKKYSLIGELTEALQEEREAGLRIGFIPLWASPLIGIAAGITCYLAVQWKNKMKWDDALDVWGVHGIGGVLGTILLGVFASKLINPSVVVNGLAFGESSFFLKELITVLAASAYAFVFTYVMLAFINLFVRVRVSEEEKLGLDIAIHGEKAYDEGSL